MVKANTNHNGHLSERAMLADLNIGFWDGRKRDKEVTSEVESRKNAAEDAGGWWTRVIPPSALKPIDRAVARGRDLHRTYTMPWANDGPRILPSDMFLKYTEELRKAESEYNEEVEKFLADYPRLVAEAPQRLGALYNPDVYPTVEKLRKRFYWERRFLPLPTAGDFRVDLGSEQTEEIRRSIEQQTNAALESAMGDLWQRLYERVSKIAEKLADPDGVFRDSLIKNVSELCDLLPKLNVTGNRDLENMRQQVVRKLTTQDPEVLRKNKTTRADAAKQAQDILNKMSAFMQQAK